MTGRKQLRISIVTPTFNMGSFIESTILGVLIQSYSNFEHIIVDGLSTDRTLEIVGKYPHLKCVSEADTGLYNALNKGIRMATGDIIGWCNADDVYLPGAFHVVNDFFSVHEQIDLVYGDYREVDTLGMPIRVRREIPFSNFLFKWLHINLVPTPSAFWRRTIHEKGIWFDETYKYANDYQFCVDMVRKDHKILHISTLLADFRRHPQAISTAFVRRQNAECEEMIRRNAGTFGNSLLYRPTRLGLLLLARALRTGSKTLRGCYFEHFRG